MAPKRWPAEAGGAEALGCGQNGVYLLLQGVDAHVYLLLQGVDAHVYLLLQGVDAREHLGQHLLDGDPRALHGPQPHCRGAGTRGVRVCRRDAV